MPAHLNGVNLGGWLILEKWMTPSLFSDTSAIDEYTFMQQPDARKKITAHRDTFITENDFSWLATHGVNAVRIPVGYWLIKGGAANDEPYIDGIEYLDRGFDWAEKHGIVVLLDIHGLPGSQNGNDHSGRVGKAEWQRSATDRKRSLEIVTQFAERYKNHCALWGIEIINEPNAGALQLALRTYYRQTYKRLDRILPPSVSIVYSDAWSPRIFAFALPSKRRAVMDIHHYHMATLGAKTHSLEWYYRKLIRRARLFKCLEQLHPVIIGEWSGVISGEVMQTLPASQHGVLEHEHFVTQHDLFAPLTGSFYWSYKTEHSVDSPGNQSAVSYWDYRSVISGDTNKKVL